MIFLFQSEIFWKKTEKKKITFSAFQVLKAKNSTNCFDIYINEKYIFWFNQPYKTKIFLYNLILFCLLINQLPLLSYLCEHLFQISTEIEKNNKGINIISTSIKGEYVSLLNKELAG